MVQPPRLERGTPDPQPVNSYFPVDPAPTPDYPKSLNSNVFRLPLPLLRSLTSLAGWSPSGHQGLGTCGMDHVSTRITKRMVEQATPSSRRYIIWDRELKGFGVRVESTGTKCYLVRYRPKGIAGAPKP